MTKYTPMPDGLVVRKRDDETRTSSGLFVTSSDKPATMTADVLAVGADVKDIMPGDVVIADYYAGAEYDGVIFLAADAALATVSS